jgi:hypothetical protein
VKRHSPPSPPLLDKSKGKAEARIPGVEHRQGLETIVLRYLEAFFSLFNYSNFCELLFLLSCTLLASVRIDHGEGAHAVERL